jgi:hypothetical protein
VKTAVDPSNAGGTRQTDAPRVDLELMLDKNFAFCED